MTIRTQMKAGGVSINHNDALRIRSSVKAGGHNLNHNDALRVASALKAGGISINHNEPLRVRSAVRAGKMSANHNDALVLGTGDLSELALGWATYGVGDHMSHYNVNASVPKTLIQYLVRWVAATGTLGAEASAVLRDIIDTEISPELVPSDAEGQPGETVRPRPIDRQLPGDLLGNGDSALPAPARTAATDPRCAHFPPPL